MSPPIETVHGEQMSQSFTTTPWFGAAVATGLSAAVGWFRGFARRAKPEDLAAVETRLGRRIDEVHDGVREVHSRIDDLYRDLTLGRAK